jgi:hypothetical protein
MQLGRCRCGNELEVPDEVVAAVVRARAALRAREIGAPGAVAVPRPRDRRLVLLAGGLFMVLPFFFGFVAGSAQQAGRNLMPTEPMIGEFLTAKNFNSGASRLGCPNIEAVNGEPVSGPLRALRRCLSERKERAER